MGEKISVAVLCGGTSTEHAISILSAVNVLNALDQRKYELFVIYITQQGEWYYTDEIARFTAMGAANCIEVTAMSRVTVQLGARQATLFTLDRQHQFTVACFFPLLHGAYGEDGCVQGLVRWTGAACVGSDVLSSAVCMDKDMTKHLLHAHGLATTPWVTLTEAQLNESVFNQLTGTLGNTLFVKPNSLGSSIGVSEVATQQEFDRAVQQAFRYDERILVESRIEGREIECAVLGNQDPVASLPSEIIHHHQFYSYEAKYLDSNAPSSESPAKLAPEVVKKIQQLSVKAFKVLRATGMLRVDFFLVDNKTPIINEVNTIPGFTPFSLYPQMWQVSGISYSDLLDKLIDLAICRKNAYDKLDRMYTPHKQIQSFEQDQKRSLRP